MRAVEELDDATISRALTRRDEAGRRLSPISPIAHDRPLAEAARGVTGVTVIDPATVLCSATGCPAVVGNVLVYRDNHLSDTYVRTISRWLEAQLPL